MLCASSLLLSPASAFWPASSSFRKSRLPCAVTSLFNVDLVFRLIDYTRRSWRGELENVSWSDYCRFLIPFPLLLVVFGQKNRRRRPDQPGATEWLRFSLGAAGVALGFALLFAANEIPALQSSFVLDHAVKLFIFTFTVEWLAQVVCGLERLAGFDTRPLYEGVILSRTPAEFWRRQNTRVQPWFYWNVYLAAGGRRSPLRGIWATFLVSALLHEIGFSIALSQITGYQFIFFLIQRRRSCFPPRLIASPSPGRPSDQRSPGP